jgi:putative protease
MKPELLAPAGNFTCLNAALQGGCDAVYFGLEGFNMRAGGSASFAVEDLPRIHELCRSHGVRAYLALNTVIYEDELDGVAGLLAAAVGRVDAVICADLAVMQICRELNLPFHVSTQVSVSNSRSAAFFRDLGAERIVLARECTLEDVEKIKELAGVQIEAFVHGAMCVSVSGRCFLSQTVFGRSANRGECLQNCRRRYLIREVEEGHEFVLGEDYVLSARDLCTLPFVEKLIAAGIDSLKVEGRNRSPEYVNTVVACYREAIDACCKGKLTPELKDRLMARLRSVYNRDFSDGFYFGRPIGDFTRSAGSEATLVKHFVGPVTNFFRKAGVAEIKVESSLFGVGDSLQIQGPTTGVMSLVAGEIRQDDLVVERARRGLVTLRVPGTVRLSDKLFVMQPRKNL